MPDNKLPLAANERIGFILKVKGSDYTEGQNIKRTVWMNHIFSNAFFLWFTGNGFVSMTTCSNLLKHETREISIPILVKTSLDVAQNSRN